MLTSHTITGDTLSKALRGAADYLDGEEYASGQPVIVAVTQRNHKDAEGSYWEVSLVLRDN